MKKVAIIGSPGAGKTTFARKLGDLTGLEVFHLDRLFWKPGWVETPRQEWTELQLRIVKKEQWIIDGNYQMRRKAPRFSVDLAVGRFSCRIIQKHGGTVKVSSETGKGTRFELFLPISSA